MEVLLGLGANIGRPLAQLRFALQEISSLLDLVAVSSVYRTAPVGSIAQPDFLNLVCRGVTGRTPWSLHEALTGIEAGAGPRDRSIRNGPRPLDIDVLACGALVIDEPELVVPHPRLHERAFVLVPLVEIDAAWRHPILGMTAAELLRDLEDPGRVERLGSIGELTEPSTRTDP